jgi:hypothetical protein
MAQDAARARAMRVYIKDRFAGADSLDGNVFEERRFPDTGNSVHKRVVEAVDDQFLFESERVSVGSDCDVHKSGVPAAIDRRINPRRRRDTGRIIPLFRAID